MMWRMGDDRRVPHVAEPSTRRSEVIGLVEIAAAMALAGSSVVVGKLLSTRVPVFLSAELSLCAALAAMLPIQATRLRELRLLNRRELGSMFLQALFGIVLFRVFTLFGLRRTSASQAGLITSAAPVLMAVFAAVFLKERVGVRGAVGICLAAAGLVVVNLPAGGELGKGSAEGNLLIFAATICEALLTLFRKSSGGRIGSVTNTTLLVAMSALMLLPFALTDLRDFRMGTINTTAWLALIYYGAVATTAAYMLWGDGAIRIPAARTGVATAAMPVSAICLSSLVLGESLGASQLGGCSLIIAAIVVAAR